MSAILKTTVLIVFQLLENAKKKKKHRLYLTPINSAAYIVCVKRRGFQYRKQRQTQIV